MSIFSTQEFPNLNLLCYFLGICINSIDDGTEIVIDQTLWEYMWVEPSSCFFFVVLDAAAVAMRPRLEEWRSAAQLLDQTRSMENWVIAVTYYQRVTGQLGHVIKADSFESLISMKPVRDVDQPRTRIYIHQYLSLYILSR